MICLPHRVERSNRSGKVCWERCGVVLWDVLYAVVYDDHYSPLGLAHSTGANTLYSRVFLRREGVLSLFPSLCSVPWRAYTRQMSSPPSGGVAGPLGG